MYFLSFIDSKKFSVPLKKLFKSKIPPYLNLDLEEFGLINILERCSDVKNYIQMVSKEYCYSVTRELRSNCSELNITIDIYHLPEELRKKKTEIKFKELKCMDVFETPDHEIHIKVGDAPSEMGYMGMNGVLLQEFLPLVEGYSLRRDESGEVIHYTKEEILELPVQLLYNVANMEN